MVGRTPEYLGKKIQSYEVKMAMLALLVLALSILGFAGLGVGQQMGRWPGLNNHGPHGLSEILYAFSSANGNNGSAFAGLSANTPWYNTTIGLAMLIGRFLMIVPDHGHGRLAGAKEDRPAQRRAPSRSPAALLSCCCSARCCWSARSNFLPGLTLGPIVEHFLTAPGKTVLTCPTHHVSLTAL